MNLPITFPDEVRAILDGRMSQSRRVVIDVDPQLWNLRASSNRQRERIKIEIATASHALISEMQTQLGQSALMLDLHDRIKKLEKSAQGDGFQPNDQFEFLKETKFGGSTIAEGSRYWIVSIGREGHTYMLHNSREEIACAWLAEIQQHLIDGNIHQIESKNHE